MTILDPEFQERIGFPTRLMFAIMMVFAVCMAWLVVVPWLQQTDTVAAPNVTDCSTNAPGCEMIWLQNNLTDIEHPILVLTPETD